MFACFSKLKDTTATFEPQVLEEEYAISTLEWSLQHVASITQIRLLVIPAAKRHILSLLAGHRGLRHRWPINILLLNIYDIVIVLTQTTELKPLQFQYTQLSTPQGVFHAT